MTAPATYLALQRVARPLRLRATAGWAALAVGAACLVLGVVAWIVRLSGLEAPYWVLLAWAGSLAVLAAAGWSAWRARSGLSAGGVAGRLEEIGAWRRGALTTLLDESAPGTSGELLQLADRVQADDVTQRGASAAEPLAQPVRTLGLAGLAVLGVGLAAVGSAGPVRGPAAALWHPGIWINDFANDGEKKLINHRVN